LAAGKSKLSRSFLRLFFWEGVGLAGFLHLQAHPIASPSWSLHFFYGSLFFLVAYPILYLYRWKVAGGCLGMVLWPLSYVLSWGLGVSAYLGLAYLLFFTGNPAFFTLQDHWAAMGFLFIFVYFPLIQPLWGVSRNYCSLPDLFRILLYSIPGSCLGFGLGWVVSQKFMFASASNETRFLIWLGMILLGTALGSLLAQRRLKG
jgi:hypothetical protein